MNKSRFAVTLLSMLLYIPLAQAKISATEWGTFTSLVGSNGKTQDGMYHEDEALPGFVHGFGELVGQPVQPEPQPEPGCIRRGKIPCDFFRDPANFVTQKMETPVIYFYAGGDIDVTVDVQFPEGMVTETFPGPTFTSPNMYTPRVIANGHTIFNVTAHSMTDTSRLKARLPMVPTGNIYEHARNVDASIVEKNSELENFIFYRGVGKFTPRLSITSSRGSLILHQCSGCGLIGSVFLVDVNDSGHAQLMSLGGMGANDNKFLLPTDVVALREHSDQPRGGIATGQEAEGLILGGLEYAGLSDEEAKAMLNTWKNGYLKVPGLRLLYIMPRQEIDSVLPVTLTPEMPFHRVFVARVEVMLDTDEAALLNKVLTARDLIDVSRLGRFAESMLRRILEVYKERGNAGQEDVNMIQRLIDRAKLN